MIIAGEKKFAGDFLGGAVTQGRAWLETSLAL
jgi:hypothetical protein